MLSNYNILLKQLDRFIRKYYRNELLKGLLFSLLIYCSSALFICIFEYLGRFGTTVRTAMFYLTLSLYILIFIKYILFPLLQIARIKRTITHKQAAGIISGRFSEIRDKLINILELAEMKNNNTVSQALLFASIENKVTSVKSLPFELAIKVSQNFRYLVMLVSAVFMSLCVYFIWPDVIREGSERMINHSVFYAPAPPFNFILVNDSLAVEQGSDFEIKLRIEGKYIPENVFIKLGGNKVILDRVSKSSFSYLLKNVNNSLSFQFQAEDFSSALYSLSVLPKPVITGFKAEIDVPAYTGISDFIIENTGDLSIPCGSTVKWSFTTSNVDKLNLVINDSVVKELSGGNNVFYASNRFLGSASYVINSANKYVRNTEPIKYNVFVIPDLFPGITTDFLTDTSQIGAYYFKGKISDDYGFKKLTFNYRLTGSGDVTVTEIPVNKNITEQEFFFAFNFGSVKAEGNEIEYYFEVWDNDAVHGSKSARTTPKTYRIPTSGEIENFRQEANKSMADKLNLSKSLSQELMNDIKNLQQSLLNNKTSSWEHTKKLENIINKQSTLENLLKQLSQENTEKENFLGTFSEQDKQLLEKQKLIDEMLENIMDDELKKMMEELKKLLENFDRTKLNKLTDKMKYNYDDLNKQLDRNLEILKRLEMEEKSSFISKELEKLSDSQKELSEETSLKKSEVDSLKEKQESQKEKFDELIKEYNDLLEKNEQLSEPMNLKDFEREKEEINNEFDKGSLELEQKNKKGASQSQKSNSENLKQMSQQMMQMMQESEFEQEGENIEDLKQIIDNLVRFSFDQEDLMQKTGKTSVNSPEFMKNVEMQKNLMNDFKLIKDSLYALAKRSPLISSEIYRQIKTIENKNKQALTNYDEKNVSSAKASQQFIMTSANNLALLLGEIIQQMQNSQQSCSGSKCKKPGKGKPSLSEMQNMQKSVKSQLQSLIDQMKKGQSQNNSKDINEKLGKMISMQDKFNQMLNELMQNGGLSPETAKQLKEIKSMVNEVEKDIVNKSITPQTMFRQEQILTRLLEAEKSERERETENKRESREGKNEKISNPEQIFKYKGIQSRYNDILDGSKIKLSKYYQDKYRKYMINLND